MILASSTEPRLLTYLDKKSPSSGTSPWLLLESPPVGPPTTELLRADPLRLGLLGVGNSPSSSGLDERVEIFVSFLRLLYLILGKMRGTNSYLLLQTN